MIFLIEILLLILGEENEITNILVGVVTNKKIFINLLK
jgi:hypothetical protein